MYIKPTSNKKLEDMLPKGTGLIGEVPEYVAPAPHASMKESLTTLAPLKSKPKNVFLTEWELNQYRLHVAATAIGILTAAIFVLIFALLFT